MSYATQINEQLSKIGITELPEEISISLKALKGGSDVIFEKKAKDQALMISALHILSKIDADLYELLPRALVFCNEIDSCEELEKLVNTLSFNKELKTVVIHDKGDSVKQRNVLYEGIDIVIGTPRRIGELYFQNGINLKHIKLFFVLEGTQIAIKGGLTPILRLNESLPKCQKIVFYETEHDKLVNYLEECLIHPKKM